MTFRPAVESSASTLVVLTKTDLPSARTTAEIRSLMRLEQICRSGRARVEQATFSAASAAKDLPRIRQWCMKFATSREQLK